MAIQHYPSFRVPNQGIVVETLAAPKALTSSSEKFQYLEATGAGNEVTFPTVPAGGQEFVIRNTSTTDNLDVKEGVITLQTLLPGLQVGAVWDGTNWQFF